MIIALTDLNKTIGKKATMVDHSDNTTTEFIVKDALIWQNKGYSPIVIITGDNNKRIAILPKDFVELINKGKAKGLHVDGTCVFEYTLE